MHNPNLISDLKSYAVQKVDPNKPQSFWPWLLLAAALPLGIAAQNLLGLVASLALLWGIKGKGIPNPQTPIIKLSSLFALGMILANVISAIINPQNPANHHVAYFLGYLFWITLPFIASIHGPLPAAAQSKASQFLLIIAAIWALIVASQYIVGWRVEGMTLTSDFTRPRGLYSHPLTLAYVAFLFWPLATNLMFRDPKSLRNWIFIASIGTILFTTQSRTIQALGILCFLWNGYIALSSVKRWSFLVVSLVLLAGIAMTNNPASEKFREMFSEKGVDRHSHYADDRLAFWDAHYQMVKEKPILGHGYHLNTAYREPYYNNLGLENFRSKYEAHNMYLQVLANGGVIGLSFFLLWIFLQFQLIRRFHNPFGRKVLLQTLFLFLLSGITQNAFQDGEVRMGLTLFCAIVILFNADQSAKLEGQTSALG